MMATFARTKIAALLLVVSLAGCGASPCARFYTLASLNHPGTAGVAGSGEDIILGLGPVTIPDYLDRPQIAVRSAGNELVLGEYDRWAGSLKHDVSRVLMENLSVLLKADSVSVVSWRQGIPSDCRVSVDLSRFDVRPGSQVVLKAQWAVFARDGKGMLLMKESKIAEPLAGNGYDTVVAAMGKALEGLGREIASGVKSVRANLSENRQGG